MKYWGKSWVAGIAGMVISGMGYTALAEPPVQSPTGTAMPMQIQSVDGHSPVSPDMVFSSGTVSPLDEEKARLSVEMDQACEKLETRLHEMKVVAMNAPKKQHRHLKKAIGKMKHQKSSLDKMHRKVSKATGSELDSTRRNWEKLKSSIDQQISASQ